MDVSRLNNVHRKNIFLVLLVLLLITVVLTVPAYAGTEPSMAPLNPDYVKYMETPSLSRVPMVTAGVEGQGASAISQEQHGMGYIPSSVDLSHMTGKRIAPRFSASASPSVGFATSYDLRSLNQVTSVKNQGSAGVCWTFASMASLESGLLKAGAGTNDFSENNLKNTAGFNRPFDGGGNYSMSTAYLARWGGPVTEADDPYNPTSGTSPTGLSPVKHVQEVLYIPDRASSMDNDNIKQALTSYGAIATTIYAYTGSWDSTSPYYNPTTKAYYYDGSNTINHGVTIVGWDDNFPASNFKAGKQPPGNGAFLIKNSWGTGFGDNGYFWISYYDKTLKDNKVFCNAENTNNYGAEYQYDPLGQTGSTGYGSNTAWGANIYTSTGASEIKAVSFYTLSPNTQYQIRIYKDVTAGQPTSGTLISAATTSGTLSYPGYHTIVLNSVVPVASGTVFSVALRLNTPGYNYPLPLENPSYNVAYAATASSGQSYMTSDSGGNPGTWSDVTSYYPNTNVCLKAFTSFVVDTTPPTVTGTDPADSATGVSATRPITITFSENVSQGLSFGNITVSSTDGPVAFTSTINISKLVLSPIVSLDIGKQYTVTIPAGAVKDPSANALAADYSFTFNTGDQTAAPPVANIAVTNSPTGTPDVISITGLAALDGTVIRAYLQASGGSELGRALLSAGNAAINIAQLGYDDGTVYVSATEPNKFESARTAVNYASEGVTGPKVQDVIIINNPVGTPDQITVNNQAAGTVIRVYTTATGGAPWSLTIPTGQTSATITIPQLGTNAGTVYISRILPGGVESPRRAVPYLAEASMLSNPPAVNNITITNNYGMNDTVVVTGLADNDIVSVYSTGGGLIGRANASSGSATVTVPQLGTAAGSVLVSVTSVGKAESAKITKAYSAESASVSPIAANIVVVNYDSQNDLVRATKLLSGDLVKVYKAATGPDVWGSASVSSGGNAVSISVPQLGTAAGDTYISVTGTGKTESPRTKVSYVAEGAATPSAGLLIADILIGNVVGAADNITVSGLGEGDQIYAYSLAIGGVLYGSATSSGGIATISNINLTSAGGTVYLSVKRSGKSAESARLPVTYTSEASTAPVVANLTAINNLGANDTVTVRNLNVGDVVRVYSAATGGTPLNGAGGTTATASEVSLTNLNFGAGPGSIYVSLQNSNHTESTRTAAPFLTESTPAPTAASITTNNDYGAADSVTVSNLTVGDVVRIYSAATGGTPLNGVGGTPAAISVVTVSGLNFGNGPGNLYVTVQKPNLGESSRVSVAFTAETVTAPAAASITATNNVGMSDTIKVTNLLNNDIVRVYSSNTDSTPLNGLAGTVAIGTTATVYLDLGSGAGSVYVSVQRLNKAESSRTAVSYTAEGVSTALTAANITVVNNIGAADTVAVSGVTSGDIVKVYNSATGGSPLNGVNGTAATGTSVTVTGLDLGPAAGTIWVTLTKPAKAESPRTSKPFAAEGSFAESDITVINNYTPPYTPIVPDVITVNNLAKGDRVRVYNVAAGGIALNGTPVGTGTVATGASLNISINQLGVGAGTVWLTVAKSPDGTSDALVTALESPRIAKAYTAEASPPPSAADITVTNAAGADSDTVAVGNLTASAEVKVYSMAAFTQPRIIAASALLGSATAGSDGSLSIPIPGGLASAGGSVAVTVKNPGKAESTKTTVSYGPDASTSFQYSVVVSNNPEGNYDTVAVSGLDASSVVTVYSAAAGGNILGKATAVSGTATVKIYQLGKAAGNVYITATIPGLGESLRIAAPYSAEIIPAAPTDITVVNNSGDTPDTVTVGSLTVGARVRVYRAATGGSPISSAVAASASASALINQLGSAAGMIYVTVQTPGQNESLRAAKNYAAEQLSPAPVAIEVLNNQGETTDIVKVSGLTPGDTIRVYDVATGGTPIGVASATAPDNIAYVPVYRLSSAGGTVYVSLQRSGLNESNRVAVAYLPEAFSPAPSPDAITITNNPEGTYDTVQVTGLQTDDIVRVYDSASKVLGAATDDTVYIYQLGKLGGTAYVTVQKPNQNESVRVGRWFLPE